MRYLNVKSGGKLQIRDDIFVEINEEISELKQGLENLGINHKQVKN